MGGAAAYTTMEVEEWTDWLESLWEWSLACVSSKYMPCANWWATDGRALDS